MKSLLGADIIVIMPQTLSPTQSNENHFTDTSADVKFYRIIYIGVSALVGLAIMAYMGSNGNAMAWRNRRFVHVQHCEKVQQQWNAWGKRLCLLWFGLFAAVIILSCLVLLTAYLGVKSA